MKRLVLALLACGALAQGASAYTVTFDLAANRLRSTTSTTNFPTTGLILLVASTTNTTFGTTIAGGTNLAVGSFLDGTTGDDQILARFNLSSSGVPGVFASNPSVSTGGTFANLDGGDRIALYWFPTLTTGSNVVPNGATSYGTYQLGNTAPTDGSAAWTMPAATTNNYKLYFLTTDADTTYSNAGTHSAIEATANLLTTPVPEPSSYAFGGIGLVALGWMMRHRRLQHA